MDLTPMTDADLDTLRIEVLTEQERRRLLIDAPTQAAQLAARYEAASATEPVLDGSAGVPTGGWGPGRTVRFSGVEWVNISGGWLAHTPTEYPRGWRSKAAPAPNPTTPVPWAEGLAVIGGPVGVGSLVTHAGRVWLAKVTHTTHAGWIPSAATHAVWTDLRAA